MGNIYFLPHSEYSSASPLSLQGARLLLGQRAQPGVMAGQGDRLKQKAFGLGNTLSEKRERLGEGRKGRRRRRRGAGQSRLVGIQGILNPSIGHCPGGGPAGGGGQGLLLPEVASWKVAWGAQGGPGGTAPLQLGKHGASSPKFTWCWLCLFRPQRPAVSSQ